MSIQIAHNLNELAKHMLNLELAGLVYDPRDRRPPGAGASPTTESPNPTPAPFPVAPDPNDPTGAPAFRIRPTYGVVMLPPGADTRELSGKRLKKLRTIMDGAGRGHLSAPRVTAASPYTAIVSNPAPGDAEDVVVKPGADFNTEADDLFRPSRMFRFWRRETQDFRGAMEMLNDFVPTHGFTWHFVPFETYAGAHNMNTQIVAAAVTVLYDPHDMFSPPRCPWFVNTKDLQVLAKVQMIEPVYHVGICPDGALVFDGTELPQVFPSADGYGVSKKGIFRCWLCRSTLRHHYHTFTANRRERKSCDHCWKEFCARWRAADPDAPLPPHTDVVSKANWALASGGAPQKLKEGIYLIPDVALLIPNSNAIESLYSLGNIGTDYEYLIRYSVLGVYE